jgi:hypothetical protein
MPCRGTPQEKRKKLRAWEKKEKSVAWIAMNPQPNGVSDQAKITQDDPGET